MERQVMDRSDEAEPRVTERPQSPQPRRVKVKPERTGPGRTLIVALILSVIAFAALAVVILNSGEEPVERTDAPDRWDAIEPGEGTLLNLGEGGRAATVIISAQDDVCWTGYIGSAEVEGCGE